MLVHAYGTRACWLPARLLAGRPAQPVPILWVVPQQPTETESTLFLLRGKLRLTAKVKACPKPCWAPSGYMWVRVGSEWQS